MIIAPSGALSSYFRWMCALLLLIGLVTTCELNNELRENGWNNAFIQSYPNFAMVLLCSLAAYCVYQEKQKSLRFCVGIVVGVVLYECLQLNIAQRTFDINDILASILAGIAFWLGCLSHNLAKYNRADIFPSTR